MKLWQKISLIALVFVTLAVQLTQFYILDSHFRSAIAREVNSAASAHSALAASLSNHAAYERLKANTLFLSTDQLTDMLKDTITTDISTADVIEVKKGGKTITAVGTEVLDGASYDLASVKPNDAITDGKTVIFDAGEKTYLMVVSIIKLEAMSYELRTVYDVTNVYDEHDANLNNARMWGLCCGGGISVLLLISVLGFLRPLKRAVKTIGAAAAGDYTVRMPEKGSSELKTLAHSINEMTASINEREEKLRGIAESRKRFADAMAHEMKTPLTSILGFADILRIKSVVTDEQRRDFASAIVEEAKRLRGLSAKLLTLASTDNTPLDFADIPVAQLFSDVHATMAPVLGRRGIKLTTLHKNAVLHIRSGLTRTTTNFKDRQVLLWHHLPFPLCTFRDVHIPNHANIRVMDFHRLAGVFGPLHILFMHHDFLNEQPQQFRRQFLNVGVAFGPGNEVVCAGHRGLQFGDLPLLLRDGSFQLLLLRHITGGEGLKLLRGDVSQH